MYWTPHYIVALLFLIVNVIPAESYRDEFNGTLFDNWKDIIKITKQYKNLKSIIPTYKENHAQGIQRFFLALTRKDDDEAATCQQLIKSRRFNYEIFYVTTSDGYILTGFHIINPKFANRATRPRPFLLFPGGFESCAAYLVNQEGKAGSLAYYLADRGEDVFIINVRGSTYSRNHTHLNPRIDPKFFDFSFDDIGKKDLPATTEYVKKVTGYDKINLYALSLTTMSVLVQLSSNPSYSQNYNLIFLAAPLGYAGHLKGLAGLTPRDRFTIGLFSKLTMPFPTFVSFLDAFLASCLCTFTSVEPLCLEAINYLSGPNTHGYNIKRLDVYPSVVDTLSTKYVAHFMQTMNFDHIREFDYGKITNLKKYGTPEPPLYPYGKIPTKNLVFLRGLNDYIATAENHAKLLDSLSDRPLIDHIITDPQWGDFDFVMNKYADLYVNHIVYNIAHRYDNNNHEDSNIQQYNNGGSSESNQATSSSSSSFSSSNQASSESKTSGIYQTSTSS